MATSNNNSLCKQAELYYYDFLSNENNGLIPEVINDHIEKCQHCLGKINQLNIGLSSYSSSKSENSQFADATTNLLKLHLAYIGNKVACKTVKPFLPVMLDPDLGIRIPTPITVHLDHCQQCAQDLEIIRGLNLSRIQSCRLGQLLADMTSEDTVSCSQAQAAIPAVVSMAFHETNEQVLKHLCKCDNCRQALYEYREMVCTEYQREKIVQKCSSCEQLSTADIFDYVVTYGLEPSSDQNAIFGDSITLHLRNCPTGLAKIQELHRTIYEIAERVESDVVTIYKINESAKIQEVDESDDLYADYPISVEIVPREDEVNTKQPASTIRFSAALRRKISALNVNSLLKTGFVAVAILLLAFTFFFKGSAAGAVTIERIYNAIDKAKNIYISTFIPGKADPTQERWISRTLNVFITQTEEDLVLWDFAHKIRKTKKLGINSAQTTQLSDNLIADVKQNISGSLGLMPFYSISDIPPNAEWNRVADDELEVLIKNTEVYELTWMEKTYAGFTIHRKWNFTIDSNTNLPHKIEVYRKSATDNTYELQSTTKVEYLDKSAMEKVIEDSL